MICLLFTQQRHISTSTAGGAATELVSKWISKKVTKYLLLLNTFTANSLYSGIIENVEHKDILLYDYSNYAIVIGPTRVT